MNKKWSSEKIIQFLEVYEQNPCLWDVHSMLYKNRDSREIAYLKMVKAMDIDGFNTADVKAKIRSIRNAYTLELTKISKSKKSNSDEIYKPRVPWFKVADRFLRQVVHIRESQSTEIGIEDSDIIENAQLAEEHEILSISSRDLTSTPRTIVSKPAPNWPKKIGQSSSGKALKDLKFIVKTLNEIPHEENEFDCFGKLIACQLKKLPESAALESMSYMQSYLVQQRLKASRSRSRPSSRSH